MNTIQTVHCPNCGSLAERRFFDSDSPVCQDLPNHQVAQTECPVCDYLMVMCWNNGSVLEAYAPGRSESRGAYQGTLNRATSAGDRLGKSSVPLTGFNLPAVSF
jgi:endogenous inhibitor of DNA gyrase (YacG/DUF329 family)